MMFENLVYTLDAIGVTDVLLPFILIFTVVFATLQKTKILGDGRKNFNVIIALVMGFSVVVPHVTGNYPFNFDPVDVINASLPQVSILIVAVLMLLLIVGVFGVNIEIAGTSLGGIITFASIVIVAAIFGGSLGWFQWPGWLRFLDDPQLKALVVMILIFGIIIYFITKEDREDKKREGVGHFWEDLGKNLKKPGK